MQQNAAAYDSGDQGSFWSGRKVEELEGTGLAQ